MCPRVLGLVLFNLFINDLETGISSEVAKFADDTKLFRVAKTRRDCEELQKDLSNRMDGQMANVFQYKNM